MNSHEIVLLDARLRFIRAERAVDRLRRRGLTSARALFLSGVCSSLADEVESLGLEYATRLIPPGEVREFAEELVGLAAAGIGYEGIAVHFDEIRALATLFAHAQAERSELWRSAERANSIASEAYRALFTAVSYGRTVGCWPRWLPESLARPCVALLHRRTGGRPLFPDHTDD